MVKNIQSVDDTGNPAQDGQTDVDEEISTAAALQEDTQRGQDDRKDDLADVTVSRISCLDRSTGQTPIGARCWREYSRGGERHGDRMCL